MLLGFAWDCEFYRHQKASEPNNFKNLKINKKLKNLKKKKKMGGVIEKEKLRTRRKI